MRKSFREYAENRDRQVREEIDNDPEDSGIKSPFKSVAGPSRLSAVNRVYDRKMDSLKTVGGSAASQAGAAVGAGIGLANKSGTASRARNIGRAMVKAGQSINKQANSAFKPRED